MGVYGPHARVVMSCVIPNIAELHELRVQRVLTFGIADPEIGSKPASGFARIANCAAPYPYPGFPLERVREFGYCFSAKIYDRSRLFWFVYIVQYRASRPTKES